FIGLSERRVGIGLVSNSKSMWQSAESEVGQWICPCSLRSLPQSRLVSWSQRAHSPKAQAQETRPAPNTTSRKSATYVFTTLPQGPANQFCCFRGGPKAGLRGGKSCLCSGAGENTRVQAIDHACPCTRRIRRSR